MVSFTKTGASLALLASGLVLSAAAEADVTYSNLGAGGSFDNSASLQIGYFPGSGYFDAAFEFTASISGNITDVELPVGDPSAWAGTDLQYYADIYSAASSQSEGSLLGGAVCYTDGTVSTSLTTAAKQT